MEREYILFKKENIDFFVFISACLFRLSVILSMYKVMNRVCSKKFILKSTGRLIDARLMGLGLLIANN